MGLGLEEDLVNPAEFHEVVHVESAQVGLQGLENAVHRDTERAGFFAIEFHLHLRGGWLECRGHPPDLRAFGGCGDHLVHIGGELLDAAAGLVLQLHGEPRHAAITGKGGRAEGKHPCTGDGVEFPVPFRDKRLGMEFRILALFPVIQTHEHHRRVGEGLRVEDVHPGDGKGGAHALGVAHDVLHLLQDRIGALQGSALGKLDGDEKISLVFIGNKPAWNEFPQ